MNRRVPLYTLILLIGSVYSSPAVTIEENLASLKITRPTFPSQTPALILRSIDGKQVNLGNLQGKIVMLNFWATWCGPCKEEMPALDRLQKHYSTDQFVILAVTADSQLKAIQAFWDILGLSLRVLLDEAQTLSQQLMIRGLPTTIIIGKDGILLGRAMGPREWDSQEAISLIHNLIKQS